MAIVITAVIGCCVGAFAAWFVLIGQIDLEMLKNSAEIDELKQMLGDQTAAATPLRAEQEIEIGGKTYRVEMIVPAGDDIPQVHDEDGEPLQPRGNCYESDPYMPNVVLSHVGEDGIRYQSKY